MLVYPFALRVFASHETLGEGWIAGEEASQGFRRV
jgi:hypothetical protein